MGFVSASLGLDGGSRFLNSKAVGVRALSIRQRDGLRSGCDFTVPLVLCYCLTSRSHSTNSCRFLSHTVRVPASSPCHLPRPTPQINLHLTLELDNHHRSIKVLPCAPEEFSQSRSRARTNIYPRINRPTSICYPSEPLSIHWASYHELVTARTSRIEYRHHVPPRVEARRIPLEHDRYMRP